MGGLGNQLFQIFTTISLSIEYNLNFYFINTELLVVKGETIRPTYWNNLLEKLHLFLKKKDELTNNNIQIYEIYDLNKNNKHYEKIILPPFLNNKFTLNKENMWECSDTIGEYKLKGYFQSHIYFDEYKSQILQITGINDVRSKIKTEIEIQSNINNETNCNFIDFSNTISMHFRLGDYKYLQSYHPLLTNEYYISSITYILQQLNENEYPKQILYFCEEPDIEIVKEKIEIIRKIYPNFKYIRCNEIEDWKQLLIMSLCKYNIIANSTFSWWAAYLNTNNHKIVCYPSVWFGYKLGNTTIDFPKDWIKITFV
jgi:hypothetical protein